MAELTVGDFDYESPLQAPTSVFPMDLDRYCCKISELYIYPQVCVVSRLKIRSMAHVGGIFPRHLVTV